MTDESRDIRDILVCSKCVKEFPPRSLVDWLAMELIREEVGGGVEYVCPICEEVVYWMAELTS